MAGGLFDLWNQRWHITTYIVYFIFSTLTCNMHSNLQIDMWFTDGRVRSV